MSENFAYTHDADTVGTFITGDRDNWGDDVWNISVDETPVLSILPRDNDYNSTEHKWFTAVLPARGAANSDAAVEGSTPSPSTNPRYQLSNFNMIFEDSALVSRTQEKQLKAGVNSELDYQMFDKMVALKQSVEQAVLCRVTKRTPKTNSKAGLMMGMPGSVGLYGDQMLHIDGTTRTYGINNTTNVDYSVPNFNAASTATGQDEFDTMLLKLKELGSNASVVALSYKNKKYVSETWDIENKTRQSMMEEKIQKVISVYETDFGLFRFIPTLSFVEYPNSGAERFDGAGGTVMINDFANIFDPKMQSLKIFDDFFTEDIPTTVDGMERRAIIELTYENAAPSGTGIFNFAGSSDYCNADANSRLPVTAAGYTASY